MVGRKDASVDAYVYSPPMRRSNVVWSKDVLGGFLADPQSVVPGTKMPFSGMAAATDQADLIAYLESQ